MKKLYRIKNWDENFENHDSRKLKKCSFVCVPNKQDGKGYRRLAKHKNSVGIFCGWSLMLQIASKLPERGLLADEDGALSAIDLSDMSGFPVEVFDRALSVLSDPNEGIEWIEIVSEENGIKTGDSPAISRHLPPSPDITGRREGKGMEQKEGGEASPYPPVEKMFDYFQKFPECDFTLEEIKIAVTALDVRKTEKGYWQWGKSVIVANNWHSAVTTKIQDRRDKRPQGQNQKPKAPEIKIKTQAEYDEEERLLKIQIREQEEKKNAIR